MKGLHKGASYKKLTAVRLVGMMLIIAVKEKYKNLEVTVASVGSGALNRLVRISFFHKKIKKKKKIQLFFLGK